MPLHSNKVNLKADNTIEGQFRKAILVLAFYSFILSHYSLLDSFFWDRVIVNQGGVVFSPEHFDNGTT